MPLNPKGRQLMPRQNRVTPFGEIIATPARGTLMGNRGCLHNDQGHIIRPYQNKRWIICQLEFKGRRRQVMAPGKYSELFFLDEASALAAGHRPCVECSRPRFNEFVTAWVQANPDLAGGKTISAGKLDAILHRERIARKEKVTQAQLSNVPTGTFITIGNTRQAFLVLDDSLLSWSPAGYGPRLIRPKNEIVEVLTPRSVVRVFALGFQAHIHPLAFDTEANTQLGIVGA